MASTLTVLLLGCWLAGWSRVLGDPAGSEAEFPITSTTLEYCCSDGSGDVTRSEPSDPVTEGTDPAGTQQTDPPTTESEGEDAGSIPTEGMELTQPGTAPAPTHSGSRRPGGPEPSAAPGLTRNIIAGVSAAATSLLLLLLVAFLCYRRKGPALRQSRESKATSTIYALVGEGKQRDVLPQEPDPGVEGLTYAELDDQALQAKWGGPAGQEPVLYATIKV